MKTTRNLIPLALTILAGLGTARAANFRIQAPVDAIDCESSTVTMMGARIHVPPVSCQDLQPGKLARLTFESDSDLKATRVELIDGDPRHALAIQGPVQSVDGKTKVVRVLGISVDVSHALIDSDPSVGVADLQVGEPVNIRIEKVTIRR